MKKRFVKKREWKVKEGIWFIFLPLISIFLYVELLIAFFEITSIEVCLFVSTILIIVEYLLLGKYPYGWKTYYEEI